MGWEGAANDARHSCGVRPSARQRRGRSGRLCRGSLLACRTCTPVPDIRRIPCIVCESWRVSKPRNLAAEAALVCGPGRVRMPAPARPPTAPIRYLRSAIEMAYRLRPFSMQEAASLCGTTTCGGRRSVPGQGRRAYSAPKDCGLCRILQTVFREFTFCEVR